jgi:type I restriction enzyme R subunit
MYNFDDEVALKYYRLQKISDGSIPLEAGVQMPISGPTSVGTGMVHGPEIELSRLIDILNDRFGTEFRPGDQLFFESIREDAAADPNLRQAALANTMENFGFVFRKALEGLFIDRMDQNEEIAARFMNENRFREAVSQHLLKDVYDTIRGGNPPDQSVASRAQ